MANIHVLGAKEGECFVRGYECFHDNDQLLGLPNGDQMSPELVHEAYKVDAVVNGSEHKNTFDGVAFVGRQDSRAIHIRRSHQRNSLGIFRGRDVDGLERMQNITKGIRRRNWWSDCTRM